MKLFTKVCFAIMLCAAFSSALDEESAKERKCLDISTTPDLDFKWMASIQKWYFPLWHKLELYRTASDMLEVSVSDVAESDLEKACVIADPQFLVDGFGRTEVPFDTTNNEDGTLAFKSRHSKYGKAGKHVLAYTDNKNFIVGLSCWEDNEYSYGIWTTEPKVSETNKQLIWKYLKSQGFKKDYFLETPYDKCPESQGFKEKKQEL